MAASLTAGRLACAHSTRGGGVPGTGFWPGPKNPQLWWVGGYPAQAVRPPLPYLSFWHQPNREENFLVCICSIPVLPIRASGSSRNFQTSGFFAEKKSRHGYCRAQPAARAVSGFFFRMASSAEPCLDFFRRIRPAAVSGFFAQGSVRIFRSTVLAVKCTCRIISWDFV